MRVALDARIPVDQWGGVQQVAQGLCFGLASLKTDSEFVVLAREGAADWLGPFIKGQVRLEIVKGGAGRSGPRRAFEAIAKRSPALADAAAGFARPVAKSLTKPSRSDGLIESLRVDVVHFLTPGAMLTSIPSIYQPHDLQHIHLPGLFSPMRRRYRDSTYRAFAEQASIVAVMTEWGRRDLVREFGLAPQKVAVVPWAPVAGLRLPSSVAGIVPDLPDMYAIYPAQTWPHKNHIRLLQALSILRDQGIVVPLVSTGRLNGHAAAIRAEAERLGLNDQVKFLGYLDESDLDGVFSRARALVFPSLFEGWGIPVVEAFRYGVPVAASNATVLPEVTDGAATLFDPRSVASIADGIERVWTNQDLRTKLRRDGHVVASRLDWGTTAATFVALYKRVAGRTLDPEEAHLLEPPTLVA